MRIMLAALAACVFAHLGFATPASAAPTLLISPYVTMPAPSLFVALPDVKQVALMDPTTNEIRQIAAFPQVWDRMVASPTKPLLFALEFAAFGSTQIDFINTNSIQVVGSVAAPAPVTGMTLSDNGNELYAASGNQLLVISVQTRTIKTAISLPDEVYDVAVVGRGRKLYATLPNLHEFAVIDTSTDTVRGYVRAGRCVHGGVNDSCFPEDIRTSPGGRYAIAVSGRNAIAVDTMTGKILAAPEAKGFIFHDEAIAVDASTSELWIDGAGDRYSQYTSINMLPPFNILSSFMEYKTFAPFSAAFTPSGQGYGSDFSPVAGPNKVAVFPPSQSGFRIRLDNQSGPIVYVP